MTLLTEQVAIAVANSSPVAVIFHDQSCMSIKLRELKGNPKNPCV